MEAIIDSPVGRMPAVSVKSRVAHVIGTIVFVSVMVLLFVTAVPYGTIEAWWKAFFVCVTFLLAILWLVEGFLSGSWVSDGWSLILPLLCLVAFSLFQTISFSSAASPAGNAITGWNSISVDPYQTRFFAMQLLALVLIGNFLLRYASTERRMRILINVVLIVAAATAIFGILRQTTQHDTGFALPLLRIEQGYGQFVNRNHFAYLMEMGLGLSLGLILGGGVKREQRLIYVGALIPLWTGLVLCNSRGGLFAMMVQIVAAALLFGSMARFVRWSNTESRVLGLLRSRVARLVLLIALVLGVAVGTLWLGGDRLASRLGDSKGDIAFDTGDLRRGVGRSDIWRVTWLMFAANPIAGVGMGAYWAAVPQFHVAAGTMTPQEAHNDYLELLASGGLVGMAIGIWFIVNVVKKTRRNLRARNRFRRAACLGATIGIIGVATHSLGDFGLHLIVNALVFTTLIVIATARADWTATAAEEVE